jgi:type IV pilus assembly protein PilA
MLQKLSRRAEDEKGFTLIELLVVILIIGILAAIAIPSFLNQKSKANDAAAKSQVKTLQTAIETYATDNNGSYLGATVGKTGAQGNLDTIEPTLDDQVSSTPSVGGLSATGYTVTSTSNVTGEVFNIIMNAGAVTRTCAPAAKGACPASGTW